MTPVRWGILSTAKIGTQRAIPGMLKSSLLQVAALASRSLPAAQEAAAALGIPRAYGSYDALLADPAIEAVYNPLPNHLHVPLTLAAAQAGKHVLCEKPIAMNAAEHRTHTIAVERSRTGPGVIVLSVVTVRLAATPSIRRPFLPALVSAPCADFR